MKNTPQTNEYLKKYRAEPLNRVRHREAQRRYLARKLGVALAPPKMYKSRLAHGFKAHMRALRIKCIEKYGGKCVCCGEREWKFLAFDHINGGGTKHRKEAGNIILWIEKNNYPNSLQLLCHNCNQAKGYYGVCPHSVIAPIKSDLSASH